MKIGIIDYGAGNLQSVLNAFHALEADAVLITSPEELTDITHLVLPGQGEFGDCARKLEASGMTGSIKDWITADKPFLGICVGYQLLFEGSDESPETPGLGIFKGQNVRFEQEPGLKIPHMGWNAVKPTHPDHPMWNGLDQLPYFYYVHSYFPKAEEKEWIACTTEYGTQIFDGAVARGNLIATQFHPEKSQHAGLQLLKNFLALG
ncbi:imidazole glycerol phosphate synthase subunit HisH [Rubritalea halochordaticola]|uniref:Imidazole glycerol phosphate synthase subunit HisH n=1 Tax=Rubritalea halochordaticola TaxID=714537 RepID=A0ABP9UVX2_9BACT